MQRLRIISVLAFLFFSLRAFASIDNDLNNFYNSLGFTTNTTAPNVYQGQEAGFYSGGSLYARNSVRDVQLAEIDLPSFRSGCGGIDLFTGGFSFINSQQLVSSFKNIMNNTAGYAFNLAIDETTPKLANAMKYMNSLASDINRLNINSCETSAGLVGSIWPRTHAAQQQVCQDIGANTGLFTDYAAARQGCGPSGQMASTLNSASGAYKNLALKNANLAWQALQKNSFLQSDSALAELFMSLSGTVIINNPGNNDSSNQQFKVLGSLAGEQQLLKALLHGGQARIYLCDSFTADGCLNPSVQTITISENNALETRVRNLLNNLVDKIFSDQPLTTEEIGLLNATRLPVYKMLNVQAAFAGDKNVLDIQSYSDVIATDMLFQYLDECLSVVRNSSATLQYPDTLMSEFFKSISEARLSVESEKRNAYAQVSVATQLIQQTQVLEQMLAGNLSTHLTQTLSWANNMREQN